MKTMKHSNVAMELPIGLVTRCVDGRVCRAGGVSVATLPVTEDSRALSFRRLGEAGGDQACTENADILLPFLFIVPRVGVVAPHPRDNSIL